MILAPVIQSWRVYQQYTGVSGFYQNVGRKGLDMAEVAVM